MTVGRSGTRLPYRRPLDWFSLLDFLRMRAIPGVESVTRESYSRTVDWGGASGTIEVSRSHDEDSLVLRTPAEFGTPPPRFRSRVERIFDLTAEPVAISARLAGDPMLSSAVTAFPGIRVPGSWDGFETAVRAVLGQAISVKAATLLAGRLAARHGDELSRPGGPGLTRLFPTAERLAEADLGGLGLSKQKMRSIQSLAWQVADGTLRLDGQAPADAAVRLLELPGVGPWTAQYIAMRAFGEADAFPAGDLILRRAAADGVDGGLSERELEAVSERWRPYRAYAAMLLWASYSGGVRHRPAAGTVPA